MKEKNISMYEIDYIDKLYAEFYIGDNPPGVIFGVFVNELKEIVSTYNKCSFLPMIGIAEKTALISAQSYFEGFFFQLFAQIINFCPELLSEFLLKRNESIEVKKLFIFDLDIRNNLGSLIAENYDFGTPDRVNKLFKDLLNITPFSNDETQKYSELLTLRNIIVHYNGHWPSKYIQNNNMTETKQKLGKEVNIDTEALINCIDFFEIIVIKTLKICKIRFLDFIENNKLVYSERKMEAIDFIDVYMP